MLPEKSQAQRFMRTNTFTAQGHEPIAPIHYLLIPKTHICCAAKITEENSNLVAKVFEAAAKIAKSEGIENGFRIITNCGDDAGQTVKHLHFHLLAGVKMGWGPESLGKTE